MRIFELHRICSEVPDGVIWSPLIFDLYILRLPDETRHAAMLCYADDVTLVTISAGEREASAALMNSDLIFKPRRQSNHHCVPAVSVPLVMDGKSFPIARY